MELIIYHHKVFLKDASSEALFLIKEHLKVFKRNFFRSKKNPKKWELIQLFNAKENSFPVGCLDQIRVKLERKKIYFKEIDRRTYPKPYLPLKAKEDLSDLWSNQTKALKGILKHPRGTIMSPPGTGKSRIILETLMEKRVKTLIVVSNQTIQSSMEKEFSRILGFKNVSVKAPAYVEENEELTEEESYEQEAEEEKVWGSSYFEDEEEVVKPKPFGSSYFDNEDEEDEEPQKKPRPFGASYFDEDENTLSPEDKFLKNKNKDYKNKMWRKDNFFAKQKRKPWETKEQWKKRIPKKTTAKRNVKTNMSVTILCYHSLPNTSKEWLESIECLLVDESHHASASSIRDSLLYMKKAAYRYFFSATPWRDLPEDMQLLISACGEERLFELTGKDAVDQKLIAKPKMIVLEPDKPDRFLGDLKKRRDIIDYAIIANKVRNQTIVNQAIDLYLRGHVVMISVDEITHVEILEALLTDLGYKPMIITGEEKKSIKQEKVEKASGTLTADIIIATMAVGEGTDIQNLTACILGAGGESSTRFLQRVTRPSRKFFKNKKGTKKEFIIVDIKDWFNPKLLTQFNKRQKHYKEYFILGTKT